jgi:hypothetical protein
VVEGEEVGLMDGYIGKKLMVRAENIITAGQHCRFLLCHWVLLSLKVGVKGAILVSLFEMGEKIDEAIHREEIGDLLGAVIGIGEVNVEVSKNDRGVLG